MKMLNIIYPFTLTHDNGVVEQVPVGPRDFDDKEACFWFAEAHSDKPQKNLPAAGTPERAQWEARRMRRKRMLEALMEEEQEDLKELEEEATKPDVAQDVGPVAEAGDTTVVERPKQRR